MKYWSRSDYPNNGFEMESRIYYPGRMYTIILMLVNIILIFSCSERKKDNPFEPGVQPSVTLEIIAFDRSIKLSWTRPDLAEFSGFNLFRSETGEKDSFESIGQGLSPNQLSYFDTNINNSHRYYYYLTFTSQELESNPSTVVSAVPGAGFNWIIDRNGYEVVKLTYDLQSVLARIYTGGRPEDLAIDQDTGDGLLLFPGQGITQQISLSDGQVLKNIETIKHPYAAEYDSSSGLFWLLDSSGFLYKLDKSSLIPEVVFSSLRKPVSLSLTKFTGKICIADLLQKSFFVIGPNGELLEQIDRINDHVLTTPRKMIIDEVNQRYWLLESTGSMAYIYSRREEDSVYQVFEFNFAVSDMELSLSEDAVYLSGFNGINSSVLQLYPDGSRQIAVTGLYNPLDIEINKYDATLLVVETGNGIAWHYFKDWRVIDYFPNLYLPHKVRVE